MGSTTLTTNDETKAITFATAFGTAPRVVLVSLVAPADGIDIAVTVVSGWSASGFTARFGFPIPASGYKLNWQAFA